MLNSKRVVVIDCQVAGISGDMFLGALLDLGADRGKVVDAIKSIENFMEGCKNIQIRIRNVVRKGFRAKKVDVIAKDAPEVKGIELISIVKNCVESLNLSDKAKKFAINSISTLVNVEASLHGESVEEVELHEAGSVDTPAEIIGSAVALDDLGLFNAKVYSTPVAVGGGLFKFSHGLVSSPAPATLEILKLKNYPIVGGPVEAELATPTGASLLINLTHEATRFYPSMKVKSIGYGAGTKDFAAFPNILRVTLGEAIDRHLLMDEIFVLETNLDDVTGEIVGHTIDKLLKRGARDVSIIPMFTKKNRPGLIFKVIADKTNIDELSMLLMEETGTLGVRIYPCERRILDRETIPVDVSLNDVRETVNVKVARDLKGRIIQIKPEYDDVKKIAERSNKPLRRIMELVKMRAKKFIEEQENHEHA